MHAPPEFKKKILMDRSANKKMKMGTNFDQEGPENTQTNEKKASLIWFKTLLEKVFKKSKIK